MVAARPVVAIVGMGGSIASVGRDRLDLFEYGDFGEILSVGDLLARVPEVAALADVVAADFRAVPSQAITPRDWLELHRLIDGLARDRADLDGIVVTHGTSTLEETAYFLNLTLAIDIPVVLVAAQRPASGLSSDGPLNLVDAVRAATSRQCRGLGVLVVLNGEIHAAREVTKTWTHRVDTFRAPDTGSLGAVDPDGQVTVYRAPRRRHAPQVVVDVRPLETLPRVDIAYSYAGADGAMIEAAVQHGARGLISAGTPAGKVTPEEYRALKAARARGVVVVQGSRGGRGRVVRSARLREDGLVAADNLNPQKARVLAMLALTITADAEEVQTYFDTY